MSSSHPQRGTPTLDSRALGWGPPRGGQLLLIETHLWRYALYRAYLNLVGEASRYYLGWLWWLLEPIAMTAVFYVVFTYIRSSNIDNFAYFLIVGITMWLWFANGVANSTDCIAVSRSIISYIRVPKLLFPIIAVSSATLKQGFVFAIVLMLMGAIFGPNGAWLVLPVLALAQFLMTLAVASTVAFACCWVRDFRFIVRSGLTLMMFCSGIFYSIEGMQPEHQELFRLNPMFVMIEQYRLVLMHASAPDLFWCAKVAAAALLWLWVVRSAFERFDLTLTRRVID